MIICIHKKKHITNQGKNKQQNLNLRLPVESYKNVFSWERWERERERKRESERERKREREKEVTYKGKRLSTCFYR